MKPTADAERFLSAFAGQLARAGFSADAARAYVWRSFDPASEPMLGPQRHTDLQHLEMDATSMAEWMREGLPAAQALHTRFASSAPVALILVPGFTHETLRNRSFHEVVDDRHSKHQVTLLQPGPNGSTQEVRFGNGPGLRMAYLAYPRSNADSRLILPGMVQLLAQSKRVAEWIAEGRRLLFVGYSNGAPLTLELLAGLQQGCFEVPGLLEATRAVLSLCGDVGGSYLADDAIGETPGLVSIPKLIATAEKLPWVGKLIGLGTPQLRADMLEGVGSLGHARRQQAMREYAPLLPAHVHYYSMAAMYALSDYRRHWWQANLDDWTMYRQALITDPITAYNDGQVALEDNLFPQAEQIPASHVHHLGA
ncbi:MAG: hypothetical protein ACPHCJ_04210, partial [Oceanococcaceae bacterium]